MRVIRPHLHKFMFMRRKIRKIMCAFSVIQLGYPGNYTGKKIIFYL